MIWTRRLFSPVTRASREPCFYQGVSSWILLLEIWISLLFCNTFWYLLPNLTQPFSRAWWRHQHQRKLPHYKRNSWTMIKLERLKSKLLHKCTFSQCFIYNCNWTKTRWIMGSLLVLQIGAITKWQWTIHTLQHNSKPTMVSTILRNMKIMSCIVNCFCLWTFTFRCTSKKQRFHKKFKKRRSKKIEKEQKGQSGKTTRKRKQIHSHGKSKCFKKS